MMTERLRRRSLSVLDKASPTPRRARTRTRSIDEEPRADQGHRERGGKFCGKQFQSLFSLCQDFMISQFEDECLFIAVALDDDEEMER
jgi:hypothetical protein